MHSGWVPPAFVDKLLWVPSKDGLSWLKCSDIQLTDLIFGDVEKQFVPSFCAFIIINTNSLARSFFLLAPIIG